MKTMSMRQFLRGGYRDISELTLITHHGRPYATWMPQVDGKKRTFPLSSKLSAGVDSLQSPPPEHGE